MENNVPEFIVIDDDRINNMLCQQIIKHIIPGASIMTFIYPEEGIAYLCSKYTLPGANNVVLFLDINMPVLNGWEVLEELKNCSLPGKQPIKIFMLSSSVDPHDKEKAEKSPLVSGFIEKPLTILNVRAVLN